MVTCVSNFWTWPVWTFVFGGLSVYQFIRFLIDKSLYDAHRKHLDATRKSLQNLRATCSDAIARNDVIMGVAAHSWVRQIQLRIEDAENHVVAAMNPEKKPGEG